MRRSHVQEPGKVTPAAWRRVAPAIVLVAAVVVAVVFAFCRRAPSIPANDQTVTGKILEFRKVVDGTDSSLYGSRIVYGIEAHVQYTAEGQQQDRWLRVSDGMSRDTLPLKLAAHPSTCVVYWPPSRPENARCWLN